MALLLLLRLCAAFLGDRRKVGSRSRVAEDLSEVHTCRPLPRAHRMPDRELVVAVAHGDDTLDGGRSTLAHARLVSSLSLRLLFARVVIFVLLQGWRMCAQCRVN